MSQTRMNGVDERSQVGESQLTGVGLSSVYAGPKAKVRKSISIMEVSDGGLTHMTKGTAQLDPITKQYTKPTNPFIGRGEQSEALYKHEEKRDSAFRAAAESLGRVLGHKEKEFWTKTLPEALYAMLDHWDRTAGELACIAFLEKRGFTITNPQP